MVRRLPLLADVFADRTVERKRVTLSWLRQRGIAVTAGQSPEEAAQAAGYFVKGPAQLSIPSTTAVPGAGGTTDRERAFDVLRSRRLVVGFDYKAQTSQPFSIHLDPPISAEEGDYIAGKRPRLPPENERSGRVWAGRVQFLTQTSKMGCYSWNLPAGPPKLGGTCPSAALGFMYSTAEDAQRQGGNVLGDEDVAPGKTAYRLDAAERPIDYGTFICNGCYALKGNYRYSSQILFMCVRLALVQTLLGGTGSRAVQGVYFVDGEAYHRARGAGAAPAEAVRAAFHAGHAKRLASGGTEGIQTLAGLLQMAIQTADIHSKAEREGRKSFAYSDQDYAAVRSFYEKELRRIASAEGQKAKPPELARAQTEKAYAWAVPEPGYFRIHDSGDFYSAGYWEAWRLAMESLPYHRFWAPNRTWAHRSPTVTHEHIPENLAMRPSALHFDDPPPTQALLRSVRLPIYQKGKGKGLAAGSGSGDPSLMAPVRGTKFHAFLDAPDEPFWECPAYGYWTQGGGAVFGTDKAPAGGTCILARGPQNEKGCRACWGGKKGEYAHVGVVYHKH